MLLSLSIGIFWLTITSQIESSRSTQYTPLYKNEQFESRISQWRLLPQIFFRFKPETTTPKMFPLTKAFTAINKFQMPILLWRLSYMTKVI